MLTLKTFGGLALTGEKRVLGGAGTQRRPLALLAMLATAGDRGVTRERLQAVFWPESDTERARKVLAQTVYAIRRDLDNPNVVLGTTELRLGADIISADVAEFQCAVAAGKFERAAALYVGPFLDGVHLSDAPEFERWVDSERARLGGQANDVLARLAQASETDGDWEVAAGWWRRLAALDPLNGRIATRLMQALAAAGDTAGAIRHARVHEMLLREELGAPADPTVAALATRLLAPRQSTIPVKTSPIGVAPTPRAPAPAAPPEQLTVPVGDTPAAGAPVDSATPPSASDTAVAPRTPHPHRRKWAAWGAALAVVAVLSAVMPSVLRQEPPAPSVDQARLVVVPFDVADPDLQLWREGMVDVLARNFDGAGPLRSISPTVVVREWSGRADRETVGAFARGKGAGMAVYGQLLRAGPDSVRASVTLLDVATGLPLAELRRMDAAVRMSRLTDSVTVDVLRAIGRVVPLGAVRAAPLGTVRSIESLRAFLLGEQFYRRAMWDSAVGHYQRAVAIDSGYALAWRRLGLVASWQRIQQDSLSSAYLLRAGAVNRRLGPRDSLLVAADSLSAGANNAPGEAETFRLNRRLFATLDTAAQRYPDDPEVWFAVGEARYHFGTGPGVGVPERATLDAFDRAIALDSAFAPAYIHAVELGFNLGGAPLGLRYARAYLARDPSEDAHRGIRLVEPLADARIARQSAIAALLDTAQTSALVSARTILRRWPDSAETAIRISRVLATGRPSDYAQFADTIFMKRRLAQELAFRGHLAEATEVLGAQEGPFFAELAYLGAIPPERAQPVFTRWMQTSVRSSQYALPYWSARRDTASLAAFARELQQQATGGTLDDEVAARLTYASASTAAHLALALGDTAVALSRFVALPDTLCYACFVDRLTRARLLAVAGRYRESLADLAEPLATFVTPIEVVFAVERGRVARRAGERAMAEQSCRFARAAWMFADKGLKQSVTDACGAMR